MSADEARLDPADIAVNVPCPRCNAAPKEACRSTSGKRISYGSHSARTKHIYLAWRAGYWYRRQEEQKTRERAS